MNIQIPPQLEEAVLQCANQQGISVDELIILAVTEKINYLAQDENSFPEIIEKINTDGDKVPVIKGTNIRVQTLVIAFHNWQLSVTDIAEQFNLTPEQVAQALNFYQIHQQSIDRAIATEQALEIAHV